MRNGPKKVILINAGKYEYAEVSLDGAIQIVGPNNAGKTTLINTLQFLYIDERSRMAFEGYTFDQTLDYYFSSEHSYVLFECQTLRGLAVIGWRGASKTSGADPERFFYLGPFRREHFVGDNGHIRHPKEISALLADKDYQLINKPAEHRTVLSSGSGQRNNGLGIVALNDGEKFSDFRDTLKNLLNLANITQDQMRERLLMLADLPTDYVAVDARRILGDEYEQLKRERDDLKQFKSHQQEVQQLISLFNERQILWGQLNYRWENLKTRKIAFDESHSLQIAGLDKEIQSATSAEANAKSSLKTKRDEEKQLLRDQSPIQTKLDELDKHKKLYSAFSFSLEQAALDNIERQLNTLLTRQQEASTETVESVKSQLATAESKVAITTASIQQFSRLAITTLRDHFNDEEISRLFGVLNPDLLGLPVGRGGITFTDPKMVVARLKQLTERVSAGVYQDDSMTIHLGPQVDLLSRFANVEALEKELVRSEKEVKRLGDLLEAVIKRDELAKQIEGLKTDKQTQTDKLSAHKQFQADLANEKEWRGRVADLETALNAIGKTIAVLESAQQRHREDLIKLGNKKADVEKQYRQVLVRYEDCHRKIAIFNASPRADAEIPEEFDSAVSYYLHDYEKQSDQTRLLETTFNRLGVFADRYKSNNEVETIRSLEQELDALPKREEALQLRWNSHIHGLKSNFDAVLHDLRLVESAKDKLNRELARVQVSDLKAVKLTIERQTDEVTLIERLAGIDELNLMDDTTSLERIFDRVRTKMERNPITRIADLFTLGVTVTRADGKTKKYADFHQVESDGTTVTIKVLFNLLVLKSLLHKDDVAIPFFLDEVEKLDPTNRRAVLQTAKKLGFIAITAAPSAVGEVDACYFLEPNSRGRVVLTDVQRLKLKPKAESRET
jgi:energy-coupling factor transporter ATP-binding protein EcfA2